MPDFVRTATKYIYQDQNYPPTCALWPAFGYINGRPISPSYLDINGWLNVGITANGDVYFSCDLYLGDNPLPGTYQWKISVSDFDQSGEVGSHAEYYKVMWSGDIYYPSNPRRYKTERVYRDWTYFANIRNMRPASGYDYTVYFAFYGSYEIQRSRYVEWGSFTFDGMGSWFEYYPGATLSNGTWMSCNRPGGHAKTMQGGMWRDVKIYPAKPIEDKAFIYSNGWRNQQMLGSY